MSNYLLPIQQILDYKCEQIVNPFQSKYNVYFKAENTLDMSMEFYRKMYTAYVYVWPSD